MSIYDKHNADLLKAKTVLGRLTIPAKDKTELIKSVDAIEKSFAKAIALAKAQRKLNDQANALKQKYDDFIAKMPDGKPFVALVYKLNDDASKANDAATKLSADATKKKDAATAKALDAVASSLLSIYRDTGSFTVFVGSVDD